MTELLFRNNAVSVLDSGIGSGDTALFVSAGHGARFPNPVAGQAFVITVQQGADFEIMRCTARSADTLTVVRGQEGTAARAFTAGAAVEMRVTAGTVGGLVQGPPTLAAARVLGRGSGGAGVAAPLSVAAPLAVGAAELTTSMATSRILGRTAAGVGPAHEISVAAPLSLSNGTLTISEVAIDLIAQGFIVADGIVDDTAGWVAAAATGRPLYYSGGTTRITAPIALNAAGQIITGNRERSIVKGEGNFNTFTWGGGTQGGGIEGIRFDSASKTGGADIAVSNHNRFLMQDVRFISTWTAMFVGKTNITEAKRCVVDQFRSPRAIHWQASDADASFILRLHTWAIAPSSTCNGAALEIDGACYTLDLHEFQPNGAPGVNTDLAYGIWAHNAIGATIPLQFIFGENVQIDYAVQNAIRLDVGNVVKLSNIYIQGTKIGSGVLLGSAVDSVTLQGLYIRASTKHGVETSARNVQLVGGEISINSWSVGGDGSNSGIYDGVYCAANSRRTVIVGCRIGQVGGAGATQRYGVYGQAGATNVIVSGCDLTDNILHPYRDDTGAANPDNFQVVGCTGVGHSWDGGTVLGSTAGFGANAICTIVSGVIQSTITIADQGRHYEVAPSVVALDPMGTGTGATFTATIANGKVIGITRTAGGSGYSAATILRIIPAEAPPAIRTLVPSTTNQNLSLRAQGAGGILMGGEQGIALAAVPAADSQNYVQVSGVAAGEAPSVNAVGSDTNIDLRLNGKGTGVVRVGTWTSNADAAVNGYITIKDSSGNVRKLATIA